jgi:sugar-specific transcriptional regulator TrmB
MFVNLEKDLVKELAEFGLSTNQAKAYLSIAQSASTNVNAISEDTKLYRQDIYKILPKLEKMGLIMQTMDRPIIIEAIPMEEALSNLVSLEQQKANQRIKRLKAAVKSLANAIKESKKVVELTTPKQDTEIAFLSADSTIKNKLDAVYDNASTNCYLVLNFELLMRRVPHLRKRFQALAQNNVKTRVIIITDEKQELVKRKVKELLPSTGDFTIKLTTSKTTVKPYLIIDNKEVYITTQKRTQRYFPCIVSTNSPNILTIYRSNFEKNWNKRSATTIYSTKNSS